MIRLSLVIATYNRAEQLLVTLDSVRRQHHASEEWECIIVDNNSGDDSSTQSLTSVTYSSLHRDCRMLVMLAFVTPWAIL